MTNMKMAISFTRTFSGVLAVMDACPIVPIMAMMTKGMTHMMLISFLLAATVVWISISISILSLMISRLSTTTFFRLPPSRLQTAKVSAKAVDIVDAAAGGHIPQQVLDDEVIVQSADDDGHLASRWEPAHRRPASGRCKHP